jgi:anti-sigma B factor antagonist
MPAPPLSFEIERHPDSTGLAVSGEIDLGTARSFEEAALALLDERPRALTLDLSGVPFCDSSGIGVLVRIYNKATVIGCRVTLRRPTPTVRGILEMTALTRIFRIDDEPS